MRSIEPSKRAAELLETDRGPVGVVVEGHGPAVVCIHGLPGSIRDFRWIAPLLAEGATVVRIDLPGFGETPRGLAERTSASRAEVVRSVIDALALEEVMIIAHSQGGAVASALAMIDSRVSRLGLLASVGPRPHRLLRQSPPLGLVSRLLDLPGISALLRRILHRGFVDAGFPRSLTLDEVELSIRCAAAMRLEEHAERVRQVRVPTLVAWARDDAIIEPEVSEELAAIAADGPRLAFDSGGHNLQKTRAVELSAAILELLA